MQLVFAKIPQQQLVAYFIIGRPEIKHLLKKYQPILFGPNRMINDNLVEILLAAILVSSTYDKDQPVIKWGGLVVGVVAAVSAISGAM